MKNKIEDHQMSLLKTQNEVLSLKNKIKSLEQECKRLQAENTYLKQLHSPATSSYSHSQQPNINSDTHKKLQLFNSLFKGRSDVFPKRWESRNGKSGYSPACDNEWKQPLCKKPKIKCSQCENRSLTPLDDSILYDHLSGKQTIGIYPLLQDDTCWFLAADFDKSSWQHDVLAFLQTCDEMQIPASLEKSRSGNGGHIWIFFSEPVPARSARQMGNIILNKTMDRRPEIGFDSYDRLFPNQDTMPNGGFGNLIALPLQKQPRSEGNSIFVDRSLRPYADQWDYLANITRMTKDQVSEIVSINQLDSSLMDTEPSEENNDSPWKTKTTDTKNKPQIPKGLLPEKVQLVISDRLYLEKQSLPSIMLNRLIQLAAFTNPEFYKAQAMRMPIYNKPRIIACHDDLPKYIALPRGCKTDAINLFEEHKIKVDIIDKCITGKPLKAGFKGKLRQPQKEAVKALREHDIGVLSATTAFGKTVVAAKMIAVHKRSTLVLVHRKQLLDQWRERLATFLSVSIEDIGQIGAGKKQANGRLDIALLQSLYRKGEVDKAVAEYGHIIVDECHHLSAFSFEQILKQVKAKYVLGLTATPIRKDGHHPIIFMQCGPIRYQVDAKEAAQERPFEHIMIPRFTDFSPPETDEKLTIQQTYQLLSEDQDRNTQIITDVISCIKKGRAPLLLTERISHLKLLAEQLEGKIQHIIVLHGGMSKKRRLKAQEQLENIKPKEERLILATGKYIGEGFDDPRLDTLFLAMPISWKGTLQQYAGRLHRLYDSKKEVIIYDYVDDQVPMLQRMYGKRRSGYQAMGYLVEEEQNLLI